MIENRASSCPEPGPLIILGAGGHGRVIADAVRESDIARRIVFYDDAGAGRALTGRWEFGGPLATCLDDADVAARAAARLDGGASAIVGMGDAVRRREWQRRLAARGVALETVVHPTAVISASAAVGAGTFVAARAVLGVDSILGAGVILNTAASVDHDCVIGDFVHLSPGALLAGAVTVGEGTWIGLGACIVQDVRIGAGSVVGAGATVLADVPDDTLVVGTPARVVRLLRP